jgi:hypothetical protein
MPDPQQGLNQPAETDAACVVLPAITELSEGAKAYYVNALVRSGIAERLGSGYSTPSERETLLTLGLAKIRECSSEIAALIPEFNKQLLASSSPNGRVNPPGDQEINDLIRDAKKPVSETLKEPQKKVSDEQLKIFAEKFQLPVSDFTDADKVRLQKLFSSQKEGQKMFEPEHLKKIESILSILWRLPGGSSIDKTITSAELYHSVTVGYRIKVGDTINELLEPLAKVVDLASKLSLHEMQPKAVVQMLEQKRLGPLINNLSPLIDNQSYIASLTDYLRPEGDNNVGSGVEKFYLALRYTAAVRDHGSVMLFGGKSILSSPHIVLDFFAELQLNPINVLVGPREIFTKDDVRLKTEIAQVELTLMAAEAIDERNKKPIERGVLKHPSGTPLSKEEATLEAAKAESAAASRKISEMLQTKDFFTSLQRNFRTEGLSASGAMQKTFEDHEKAQAAQSASIKDNGIDASKSAGLDFSPLPIPLDELQELPLREYIQLLKKNGEIEEVFSTNRESDGFKRLTMGFYVHLLSEWNKNAPAISQNREQILKFLTDPRLLDPKSPKAFSDAQKAELVVYNFFGKIDAEMYQIPLSRKAAPFGLLLSKEDVDSLTTQKRQLEDLSNILKSDWNVTKLEPEVAIRIAYNPDLFKFFSILKNADDFKNLTQNLFGTGEPTKQETKIQSPEKIKSILEDRSALAEKTGELQQIFGKESLKDIFLRDNSSAHVITTLAKRKDGLKSLTESLVLLGAVTNPNETFTAANGVSLIARSLAKSRRQNLEIDLNDTKFKQLAEFYCLNYLNSVPERSESRQVEATRRLEKLIALSPKELSESYDEYQKALAAGQATPATRPKLI